MLFSAAKPLFKWRWLIRWSLATWTVLASVPAMKAQDEKPKCPPVARTENVADDYHGTSVMDPYRWLEDQASPETRAWIDAENRCTETFLNKLPGRDVIAKRLGELLRVDTVSAPAEHGGKVLLFQTRRRSGFERPLPASWRDRCGRGAG